jgi:hypothetical protein
MILSVKVCFYTYEENKKNHVRFEFHFDGLGFGSDIRPDFDFLRSLCDGLNSLDTLIMKDFTDRAGAVGFSNCSNMSYRPLSETC